MKLLHDCNRINRILYKEYIKELLEFLKSTGGINDIENYIKLLQSEYAKYIGTNHAFITNSGTSALQLSLLVLGVGKGDNVIIPDMTSKATALAVLSTGANPVLADIKKSDLTIDEKDVEKKIDKKTKAIVPVHLFCQSCEMDTLMEMAEKYNLYIVEDACQGHGGTYKKKMLGSFGELNAFSFNYYKSISTFGGSGGIITFNNASYYEKLETLSKSDSINPIELLRANFRRFEHISLFDAITVRIKLKHANLIKKSLDSIKKIYENELNEVNQINIFKDVYGTTSMRTIYAILAAKKDLLKNFLLRNSVMAEDFYIPISMLDMLEKSIVSNTKLKVSNEAYSFGLQLPMFPLMKKEEVYYITDLIKKFYSVSRLKSLKKPW